MAHSYEDARKRSLELNKGLKGSKYFARPKLDRTTGKTWDVEIVDTVKLIEQHEANKKQFQHYK